MKKPDFDKMWLQIQEKINYPVYCMLRHKPTGHYLSKQNVNAKRVITALRCKAEVFEGNDAKPMAVLFLFLCQSDGQLLDFEVAELEWGKAY